MATHNDDLVSLEELRSVLSAYAGPAHPRRRPARHGVRRRRPVALGLMAAAGAIAVVLAATPAWALVRDALPFWSQPSAPQPVKVNFSTLNTAAPAGMNPQADVADTREVMKAVFGGKTQTLYVSPAKNSGYCFMWSDFAGGCNTTPDRYPLDVSATIVPPHDSSQPPRTVIYESEMRDLNQHGVVPWLTVDAASPAISDVVIHFSDGTSVQPEITWVSAPINAGFFAFEVPNDKQSATDHVTEVDAYDATGNLVERQPMAPMTSPIRQGN